MALYGAVSISSGEFPYDEDWRDLRKMYDEYKEFNNWLRANYPTYKLNEVAGGNPANPFEVIKEILMKLGEKND